MTYYFGPLSQQSNRADWSETFTVVDADTGLPVDISTAIITMSVIYRPRNPNFYLRGGLYYDYGPNAQMVGLMLTGGTATGEITRPGDVGTFTWLFPYTRMASLMQGQYEVGIRVNQGGSLMQLLIGTIDIFEGLDTQ